MPEIEFALTVDQYETDYYYTLPPVQFEMRPQVDVNSRVAMCDLGLWNKMDATG